MKNLYPIFLLLLLVTCKKKQDPEPLVPAGETKQELPTGVLAFTIDEVPQKNIRFISLDANMPNRNRIMVTLPLNYTKGDELIARIKLPEGCIIRDRFLNEYDANVLNLNFSKSDQIWLLIYDKKNDRNVGDLIMYVDPSIPMVAPAVSKNYEEVLEGQNVYLYLPVQNLGTAETITENDSLVSRVTILIKNKQTGATTVSNGAYFLKNSNNDLFAEIPAEMEAGEFELTVQKQSRKVVIPDALVLKNGKPIVKMLPLTSVCKNGKPSVTYEGYNLLPSHDYTMELKNDFHETIYLKLTPGNQLSLIQNLPPTVPSGNYETTLFIDGKAVPSYISFNSNVLGVKKETSQPIVMMLSNLSHAVYGEVTLYKAITTFKRSEPIIADLRDGIHASMVLLFKNIGTSKEYELPYSGTTTGSYMLPFFTIPKQVPNGKYEVRVKEGSQVSEIYQRIITID